ncbi:MAG: hypothetical protein ABSG17_11270 [Spirochaetia bacterium]
MSDLPAGWQAEPWLDLFRWPEKWWYHQTRAKGEVEFTQLQIEPLSTAARN